MSLTKNFTKINSSRHKISILKNSLSKSNNLIKINIKGFLKLHGRNNSGRITIRHRGGKLKNKYRNLFYFNEATTSVLISTFYDPSRTAFISLNFDLNKYVFFLV